MITRRVRTPGRWRIALLAGADRYPLGVRRVDTWHWTIGLRSAVLMVVRRGEPPAPTAAIRRWLREARNRVAPPAEVIAFDQTPLGPVTTKRYADRRSPTGFAFQTVALFPDGTRAEHRWSRHQAEAEAAHDGAVTRHRRRTLPDT